MLKAKVDEILKSLGKQAVGKVLLVTHSMGGLVARSFSQDNAGLVMGVVHGVMPAVGAAAAYYRMVAGAEWTGVDADMIGPTGAHNQPVMGFSPGALQLLPTKEYGLN
jgi:pimeloyl-ACP methyl ester carboxylesterase